VRCAPLFRLPWKCDIRQLDQAALTLPVHAFGQFPLGEYAAACAVTRRFNCATLELWGRIIPAAIVRDKTKERGATGEGGGRRQHRQS